MPTLTLTPDVQSRARRAGYDPDVLADATVLVVGAGALGQNVAQNLALTGVGELRIVDGDRFEDHNRSRSPLHPRRGEFSPGDDLAKASCVARELARIHVDDEARILAADAWIEDLGLGAFDRVDVIAACVDSLTARAYLATVAIQLGIGIVDGGFSGANLGMTVYPVAADPSSAPCWSCGGAAQPGAFSCDAYARYAQQAGVVPAIQTGAAALGALCAEAVVSVLHGREADARHVALDLRTGDAQVSRPRADPVCSARHRRLAEPHGVSVAPSLTVAEALEEIGCGDATLFLPDAFVERANCPSCGSTCDVAAPTHRWRRNPLCVSCDGPWPCSEEQIPSPDTVEVVHGSADPRSALTLEALGLRAGDVVEVEGAVPSTFRIAGGHDQLYTYIPLAGTDAG